MIVARNLTKAYGDANVVRDVSIEIRRGGVTSIIGPNGAGKSTLLGLLSRLLPASTGSVHVDDLDVMKAPSDVLARRLSILRQDNHLTARLTVRDLVAFGRFPHSRGRLTADDLPRLAACGPDVAGVRGAACSGGRRGSVSAENVMTLRAACLLLDPQAR